MLSSFLQKLLFVNQFTIGDGKISILGDREIMLHASALLELQEIDESKLYSIAKKASMKKLGGYVEHAKVYGRIKDVMMRELVMLGKKIGDTDEGTLKTLESLFDINGLGKMKIEDLKNTEKEALITIKDSPLADEWTDKNKKKSKNGVCTLTAGVIAGMFSYIFGKDVDCLEQKCKAQGDVQCVFKVG